MALFMTLLIVGLVLSIVGFAVEGLFWLFLVGTALFLVTLVSALFIHLRKRGPRTSAR